ncbi:MAG TPA: hypothetical protein VF714_01845, partial [Jatrophihabitans sp.]
LVDPEETNLASRRVLEKNGLCLVEVKQLVNLDGAATGPSAIYRCRFPAAEQAGSVGDLGGP